MGVMKRWVPFGLALLFLGARVTPARAQHQQDGSIVCSGETAASLATGQDGRCSCKAGWGGPECKVCRSDAACRGLPSSSPTDMCQTTPHFATDMHAACTIGTQGLASFFGGSPGAALLRVQRSSPSSTDGATVDVSFMGQKGADGPLTPAFVCGASDCTVEREAGTDRLRLVCMTTHCRTTCTPGKDSFCISILSDMLSKVGSDRAKPFTLLCEADGTKCAIHESVLEVYYPGTGVVLSQCSLGECGAPSKFQSAAADAVTSFAVAAVPDSPLRTANVVIFWLCAVFVLLCMVAGVGLYWYIEKRILGPIMHKSLSSSSSCDDHHHHHDPPSKNSSSSSSTSHAQRQSRLVDKLLNGGNSRDVIGRNGDNGHGAANGNAPADGGDAAEGGSVRGGGDGRDEEEGVGATGTGAMAYQFSPQKKDYRALRSMASSAAADGAAVMSRGHGWGLTWSNISYTVHSRATPLSSSYSSSSSAATKAVEAGRVDDGDGCGDDGVDVGGGGGGGGGGWTGALGAALKKRRRVCGGSGGADNERSRERRGGKGTKVVLCGLSGRAKPGEVLAIMGPSGAGKTTLLDILSLRDMAGHAHGHLFLGPHRVMGNATSPGVASNRGSGAGDDGGFNTEGGSECVSRRVARSRMAYLPQAHIAPQTLTVAEAVTMAAMLRMPRWTAITQQHTVQARVVEALQALGIESLANRYIGSEVRRGLSGGEARRVAVAMELTRDPEVLFLDECTSGLDSYNAEALVDVLHDVALHRRMAVVMTIHQPKYGTFLRLSTVLLLHHGRSVFFGRPSEVSGFLERALDLTVPLPPHVNPADLMIDALFTGALIGGKGSNGCSNGNGNNGVYAVPCATAREEETRPLRAQSSTATDDLGDPRRPVELVDVRVDTVGSNGCKGAVSKARGAEEHGASAIGSDDSEVDDPTSIPSSTHADPMCPLRPASVACAAVQMAVVSQRLMRDHVRRPWLMASHVLANVYMAVLLGLLYLRSGNETSGIAAIQNRMGIFMLEALFLAFTSVSAIPLFWLERGTMAFEVANGYYSPAAYFAAKTLSDLIPLRVVPPVLMAVVTYAMVQFRGGLHFLYYCYALVLLSCVAATINGLIGVVCGSLMSGILAAMILLLHLLVLTSIFVNFSTMQLAWLGWARYVSFFQYGYEALVSNEMAGRTLTDMPVESGSAILAKLGFHPDRLDMDVMVLFAYLVAVLLITWYAISRVKERR